MELGLQFGYGMMDHSRALVRAWGQGVVVLSPRDLDGGQLDRLSYDVHTEGGGVLFDPQFYLPDADHGRLTSHDYWPNQYETGAFWSGDELRVLLKKLVALNERLSADSFILPGIYAHRVDDDWSARQQLVIDEARNLSSLPKLATVALSADAVRANEDIDEVLAAAEKWDVEGIYLVCEHPQGNYLVADPTWLSNQLDLVAGLALKGKTVLVGYANHQQLILVTAGASALASGTWMNVRSFPPDKFRVQYDDEIKQRATWFYCPQALSEYKVQFLDIAQKQGVLDIMRPPPELGSAHADVLFAVPQPSSAKWTEQAAFRHYLQSFRSQVTAAHASTFDAAVTHYERCLDEAERVLGQLHAAGVRGQARDFMECVDVGRAAVSVLKSVRGPMLRRQWSSIIQ